MAHYYLNKMESGASIVDFYILNRANLKKGKTKEYMELELQDVSGIARGVMWEFSMEEFLKLQQGKIVKIMATVNEYNGRRELHIQRIRPAEEKDDVDMESLVEKSQKDFSELVTIFEKFMGEISHPHIKQLLDNIFGDADFKYEYYNAPAGKKWHHCYKHGLLEHTVNMLKLSATMREFYPELNGDLLTCGIILHDVGKLSEYNYDIGIDFSDGGRLNGHIAMGYHFAMTAMEKIPEFPEELKYEIGHLILSHQGALEKASPVVPMTLEAIVLHYCDELDAETNAVSRLIRKNRLPESKWTSYNNLMGRFFYAGEKEEKKIKD